jgi:hypothetical protein
VHLRAEGDGVLDGQARVERGVAVLEHHLHLAAELAQRQVRPADAPVEDDLAASGDQVHQQPRGGGLAAARFADDAERLALAHVEVDAVDRAHDLPVAAGRAARP